MSRADDIELMQHVDGELDGDSGEMRAKINRNADLQTKAQSLGQMHELLSSHLELTADAVPDRRFESMWREVKKAIDVERPVGLWAKISSWFERHRGHVITGAVSAGAVAALALILRGDAETIVVNHGGTLDVQPAALRAPPVIDNLETPGASSTVLNIEDEDGHMTVIVVTPADTVEGI
jgi:hypothetical protein